MLKQSQIRELVKKTKSGKTEAFGTLYDIFIDPVYRFVYFRVNSKEEAEDLTETIFMKMFEKIGNYQDKGLPFEAWIFRIARNQVIDYYRTKKHSVQLDESLEIEDTKKSVEEIVEIKLLQKNVLESLKHLPSSYQEVIILKFIEEKDNIEISQILNKPVDQVRVLQSRALKTLKKVLKW